MDSLERPLSSHGPWLQFRRWFTHWIRELLFSAIRYDLGFFAELVDPPEVKRFQIYNKSGTWTSKPSARVKFEPACCLERLEIFRVEPALHTDPCLRCIIERLPEADFGTCFHLPSLRPPTPLCFMRKTLSFMVLWIQTVNTEPAHHDQLLEFTTKPNEELEQRGLHSWHSHYSQVSQLFLVYVLYTYSIYLSNSN